MATEELFSQLSPCVNQDKYWEYGSGSTTQHYKEIFTAVIKIPRRNTLLAG